LCNFNNFKNRDPVELEHETLIQCIVYQENRQYIGVTGMSGFGEFCEKMQRFES